MSTTPTTTEILRVSKHGFTLDLTEGDRRCHLRVFEFEDQQITPDGARCEMPVTIDHGHLLARLRQAVEQLREHLIDHPELKTP